MVLIDRRSLHRNTINIDHLIKLSLCASFLQKSPCLIYYENCLGRNQPFTKFVEAANNLTKLVEVGKQLTKFVKFANNFTKFEEFANNFTKFVELAKTLRSSRDSQTTFM